MKAIILTQVSTEEQTNDGQSLQAQLSRARNYVQKNGFDLKSEHHFDKCSTIDRRKKFELMIDEIKSSKEIIALTAETIASLQRRFKEAIALDDLRKENKIEIHFLKENLVIGANSKSLELLRWDMGIMFAQNYILQLSDNIKRAMREKKERGEPIGRPKMKK